MSDHPLLLDIFSLGSPQLRTGLGFLFSFKVSFEKHPNVQPAVGEIAGGVPLRFQLRQTSSSAEGTILVEGAVPDETIDFGK